MENCLIWKLVPDWYLDPYGHDDLENIQNWSQIDQQQRVMQACESKLDVNIP